MWVCLASENRNQNGYLPLLYISALWVVLMYIFVCSCFVHIKCVCEQRLSSLYQDRLHCKKISFFKYFFHIWIIPGIFVYVFRKTIFSLCCLYDDSRGYADKRDRQLNPAPLVYQFWEQNHSPIGAAIAIWCFPRFSSKLL